MRVTLSEAKDSRSCTRIIVMALTAEILRCHECGGGRDPLTRPAPAGESAVAVHPLPQGGEGIFTTRGTLCLLDALS
jgi:hypothetical protein